MAARFVLSRFRGRIVRFRGRASVFFGASRLGVLALALLLTGASAYASTIYAVGLNNTAVYTVDPTTGTSNQELIVFNAAGFAGADLAFANGILYSVHVPQFNDPNGYFGSIDVTTGAFTPISVSNALFGGLAYNLSANVFYASHGTTGALYSITPGGVETFVGTSSRQAIDLAWNNVNGRLYGISSSRLFRIDPGTAAITDIGIYSDELLLPDLSGFSSLAFDPDTQTLYLHSGITLYQIDANNASLTIVGNGAFGAFVGLTAASVPEPRGLALCTIGFALILGARISSRGLKD